MNKQQTKTGRGIEWRTIPGLEGRYEASSAGQIRSLPRNTTRGKVLTPQLNNSGYLRVSIGASTEEHKYQYVHHLVALAFLGSRPAGNDINHKNGIKTDNRAENLEYATRTENMKHAREYGLYDNRGEKQWNAKLTDDLAFLIRIADSGCGILDEVVAVSGFKRRTIMDVIERKTWRHIP